MKILILFCAFILSIPACVFAETRIKNGDLNYDRSWTKSGSPYILDESVYVPNGVTLSIDAGVTVMSASTTDEYQGPNSLNFDKADLSIHGTATESVYILGLESIFLVNSNSNIENTVFDSTGLNLLKSTSTLINVTIKNSLRAIHARASNIEIKKSKLLNNSYGIYSNIYSRIFLMFGDSPEEEYGIGGIGDAVEGVADMVIDPTQNIISIKDSSIIGNTRYGIFNRAINPISAENNWWGNVNGPTTDVITAGDTVSGLMSVTPWRDKDPDEITCCSNVLFLPGIQASRLYKDVHQYLGTSTDQLWEPYGNTDIKKLYLDSEGKSLDDSIYTSDILDSAFNLKNIYKSFVAMMNSVVAENIINSWLPFPYDWRMSVDDIVYGETKLSTTSVSLINTVEELAKNSRTGKVAIVTHSNGGLVGKMLVRALEEKNMSEIIEKVINVAVPELGTPKAILSMLHGYDQSIFKSILMSEGNARNLSQNMLGAYGLLPSRKFFEQKETNESKSVGVIFSYFSSSTEILASTFDSMRNFLTSNPFSKIFSKKSSEDVNIPLLLNSSMIDKADKIHSIIDNWRPASTTKTISLLGWGLPTSQGLIYKNSEHCANGNCDISYIPDLTDRGDGTVLVKSNSGTSDKTLFFNLKELDKDTKNEINHANILESSESLNLVKKQISNTSQGDDYGKYITSTEPIDTDTWLTIQIFSPVDIDIYDKEGNHTGLLENFDPKVNFDRFETGIPLSYYLEYSDVKLVRLLYGEDYKIILKGNDAGSFIVKAEVEQFEKVIASTTFGEMPVTPLMNVEMIIPTITDSFATSSLMNIDMDGDGNIDFVNYSKEFFNTIFGASTLMSPSVIVDYATYMESIRKTILALDLPKDIENNWLKRIDKILEILEKKDKKYSRVIEKNLKRLTDVKFEKRNLNSEQKIEILEVFEKMLDNILNSLNSLDVKK